MKKEKVTMLVHTKHHLWGREKKTTLTENEKIAAELFFSNQLIPTDEYLDYTNFECVVDGERLLLQLNHPAYFGEYRPIWLAIHKGCGPRVFGARCVILRGGRLRKAEPIH